MLTGGEWELYITYRQRTHSRPMKEHGSCRSFQLPNNIVKRVLGSVA